jgi:hypothetical protein
MTGGPGLKELPQRARPKTMLAVIRLSAKGLTHAEIADLHGRLHDGAPGDRPQLLSRSSTAGATLASV